MFIVLYTELKLDHYEYVHVCGDEGIKCTECRLRDCSRVEVTHANIIGHNLCSLEIQL